MGSEVILYFYGAVCLSMLAFNIIFSLVNKVLEQGIEIP